MHATRSLAAALFAALAATPAPADEIEDAIAAALSAYRAGDIAAAKEEIDYAAQLLARRKAEGLQAFLPEPMPGWTRSLHDPQSAAMFGGGLFAGADYRKDGETVSIRLIADSPVAMSMAAIFANPAMMAMQGRVLRVGREKFLVKEDGIFGLIGNRVMVEVSGDAPEAVQIGYLEAIDLGALAAF
ncbi:MAG: hypothetical protein KatS3mg118_0785 [Paracoccaceae bacterium]|nr:MAG: hypothetical protein KatS3mg118_0785 [Paracoccaceae bacterium]